MTRSRTRRVVIAPDSFKGSATAQEAASAIADGWRAIRADDDLVLAPQADGGEGTLDALEASNPGSVRRSAGSVTGPDGRAVPGEWLELADGTAVVEMAQMAGLPLMQTLDALGATSRGLGEVIRAAIDSGARRLLIGIGGSASTDAGVPMLDAIGDRMPPPDGALVLTDVTAPLLGPRGAAAVFGPQKGASARDVAVLEERLRRAAVRLGGDPDEPGAGAAGGVGFALSTWGATLTSGAAFIAEATHLSTLMDGCDVLLTGEGRFDHQSLTGKVVGSILSAARERSITAGAIVGAAAEPPPCWHVALADLAGSARAAMADPRRWLIEAGRAAASELGAVDQDPEGGRTPTVVA